MFVDNSHVGRRKGKAFKVWPHGTNAMIYDIRKVEEEIFSYTYGGGEAGGRDSECDY